MSCVIQYSWIEVGTSEIIFYLIWREKRRFIFKSVTASLRSISFLCLNSVPVIIYLISPFMTNLDVHFYLSRFSAVLSHSFFVKLMKFKRPLHWSLSLRYLALCVQYFPGHPFLLKTFQTIFPNLNFNHFYFLFQVKVGVPFSSWSSRALFIFQIAADFGAAIYDRKNVSSPLQGWCNGVPRYCFRFQI